MNATYKALNGSRRQRGYALVSVLWATALLSLIAAMLLMQARTASRIETNALSRAQAEAVADAAVSRAVLAILAARGAAPPRFAGAPLAFTFERADVEIRIQDEFGKVDLNAADETRLRALLREAGLPSDAAERLAARIVERRATNASGTGFRSADELRLVSGMTQGLFERLRPALTVHSQSANIDPEVAPELVLRILPGFDERRIRSMLASRPAFSVLDSGTNADGAGPPLNGRAFAIAVDVRMGRARLQTETIVRLTGDPHKPFWILERREAGR